MHHGLHDSQRLVPDPRRRRGHQRLAPIHHHRHHRNQRLAPFPPRHRGLQLFTRLSLHHPSMTATSQDAATIRRYYFRQMPTRGRSEHANRSDSIDYGGERTGLFRQPRFLMLRQYRPACSFCANWDCWYWNWS